MECEEYPLLIENIRLKKYLKSLAQMI